MVENERLKLTETLLNTLAAACFVIGIGVPLLTIINGWKPYHVSEHDFILSSLFWIAVGICLHFVGRSVLGDLKEQALWRTGGRSILRQPS
jgi:hypothetical protein